MTNKTKFLVTDKYFTHTYTHACTHIHRYRNRSTYLCHRRSMNSDGKSNSAMCFLVHRGPAHSMIISQASSTNDETPTRTLQICWARKAFLPLAMAPPKMYIRPFG